MKPSKKFFSILICFTLIPALLFLPMIPMLSINGISRVSAAAPHIFVHPGMIHTEASFETIRSCLTKRLEPNLTTWEQLKTNGFSAADWNPRATETVIRGGDGSNYAGFHIDLRRAYQNALLWNIGKEEDHGTAACRILNAWSSTMKKLTGNADRFLAAGIYGYQLANISEIMRSHDDFDLTSMQALLLDVFYPLNQDFLQNHNGAHIGNYWANWDLCNIASMMSIGIFCDREDIYQQAVSYYRSGLGNGSLYHAMPFVFEDQTAQWQESGRDQGHTTLGVSLCEIICEMAWNQGDDLYGLSDNRFLKAAEYVLRYNSGDDTLSYRPYEWLKGQTGSSQWMSDLSSAGRGSSRPVYTMLYNHYVRRMGLSSPVLKNYLYPDNQEAVLETFCGNGDELGWQSLTFANLDTKVPARYTEGYLPDGLYRLRSVLSQKSLVAGNDNVLSSYPSGEKEEEWWQFINCGDGEYVIQNKVTQNVLQIASDPEKETSDDWYSYGTRMETGTDQGLLSQRFALAQNSDGTYRIIPSANFYVICLSESKTENDTPIIQWRNYSDPNQKWIIEAAKDVPVATNSSGLSYSYEDKFAAEDTMELIRQLKTMDASNESKEKLQTARISYEALTELQKSLVENLSDLVQAENTYQQLTAQNNETSKEPASNEQTSKKSSSDDQTPKKTPSIKKGNTFSAGKYRYKITKADHNGKGTVKITGFSKTANKKTQKKINIPASVKWKGIRFQVTVVSKKAFQNCKKLKTLIIGKNIRVIQTKAFYRCKNCRTIKFKGTKLTTIEKKAFQKGAKKISFSAPKKKLAAYQKLFRWSATKI